MDAASVLLLVAATSAVAFAAGRRAVAQPRTAEDPKSPAPAAGASGTESPAPPVPGDSELLRVVVEQAPMAVLAFGPTGKVSFSNEEARLLFAAGTPLEGQNFLRLLERAPAALRESLLRETDLIFTLETEHGQETFGLARRQIEHHGETETLLIVKELTAELERQELDVWKKVIRVINHELNNSLAPILSMAQTARVIVKQPGELSRLDLVFSTIEERAAHLSAFLAGYADFARLPRPRPQPVTWAVFLDGFRALYPDVTIAEAPPGDGYFDPGQLQQVVINLLKNAREASDDSTGIELRVQTNDDGSASVIVADRGSGMSDETLKSALLPFFSTKERGTGLGLALAREIVEAHRGRLSLARREGGGIEVSCWLPGSRRRARPRSQTLTLTRP